MVPIDQLMTKTLQPLLQLSVDHYYIICSYKLYTIMMIIVMMIFMRMMMIIEITYSSTIFSPSLLSSQLPITTMFTDTSYLPTVRIVPLLKVIQKLLERSARSH